VIIINIPGDIARALSTARYEAQFFILITGTSVTARRVSLGIRSIKPTARVPLRDRVAPVPAFQPSIN